MMNDSADRALAIVGVSGILPDAPDVQTFWSNVKEGRYSIGDIPPERWDPDLYYDPDPSVPGKTYSRIGGFVRDWEWAPMEWRLPIPPKVADAMDEAQRWSVACARSLLIDYGHPERPLDFERTAVVVGTAMAGDLHYWTALPVFFPEYARALAEAPSFAALGDDVRQAIRAEMGERVAARFPAISEDSMPGELANCIAGRIANLFDFHGPNFTCDAACASALAAIDAAREGLITGEYDAAIVGGVDRNMGPAPFVKFCKIGALSATGTRPYADGADGFVMGEGAAFFLLKRLADAEAAGDRIYAVLRGVGGASDGRGKGITAPNPAGQRLAVERAWEDAGLSPATVGLLEGHGTSTRVGDVVEVQALTEVLSGAGASAATIPLGSVKSNIGHLKGAAGGAGLLKVVGAIHEKVLLPSVNFERPNPNIDFASSPLYVNTELKPWDAPPDGVRRAAVSAFGFGGTNYHAVLEEHVPGRLTARRGGVQVPADAPVPAGGIELRAPLRGAAVLGAADEAGLLSALESLVADAEAGRTPRVAAPGADTLRAPLRLAIDHADAAELASKGTRALRALQAPAETRPAMVRALRAQGVHLGRGAPGKVAFLYTGQGSQYANMLRGLRESEPVVRDTFEEADRVLEALIGRPLSEILFVDPDDADAVKAAEAELRKTEITQPAVLTVDAALTRLLAEYGIVPDLVMGHSLGEYGALVAAGALPFADALEAVSARGREMASLTVEDNGLMAAVFAPMERVEALLAEVPGNVVVANINSTSQAVIGGATEAVEQAMEALRGDGHDVVQIPVSHAFHTSIVSPASEPLKRTLERLSLAPPSIPIVGNVHGELYPMGPGVVPEMIDLLGRQVASPVQFVKGLGTLYELGARVFVEVGPKRALHGFVEDVLGGRDDVLALFTNHPKTGDSPSFNQALCGLWASGVGVGEVRPEMVAPAPAPAPAPSSAAPAPASRPEPAAAPVASLAAAPVAAPAAGESAGRYGELGRLFAEFLERGAALMGQEPTHARREAPVVTGAALGLPGGERIFDEHNVQRILDGEQEIDLIPTRFRHAMIDKNITRLVKSGGEPHFEAIQDSSEVIKLAARAGALDLEQEFGVPAERVAAFDIATQMAIGAGIEALRDAGIPLVMNYRDTSTGGKLPDRWMLPEPLRDETGVIFAAAFPGYDAFAGELARYHADHGRETEIGILRDLLGRAREDGNGGVMADEIERRLHELEVEHEENAYQFDRRFLFRVLSMGHSQFAEYVGARGPNTHINSACASTTQAFALAEDWIAAGRCRRVVIVAADDATSENMLEWVGAGFLATGAAATDDVVEEAALPFDRRRHGMILGMGAAGVVVEARACADERGLRPICEVLSTVTANSAFHGTRLDVSHIAGVMEQLVSRAEQRHGLDRRDIARELLFVSHETYTPARGGSASAEVEALRRVFGAASETLVVANTKGLTGHPMGVGIEDAVAVKALETGTVPPVPNYQEPDPELGTLHLSRGGRYPIRYALRLGAGFGSQISMSLLRWCPSPDGARPAADALGYEGRIDDPTRFAAWLAAVSGLPQPQLEVVARTLRVRDDAIPVRPTAPAPVAAAPSLEPTAPVAAAPSLEPTAPVAPLQPPAPLAAPEPAAPVAAPPPAAGDDEAAVRERVLAIVAEKTGYPVDMLEPDLDLEADLGIDTVKLAETFAAIREEWDIPRDENLKLRDYPTLGHAVRFVQERRPDTPAAPAAATSGAPAAEPAAAADGDEAAILERVLAIVAEKTGYPAEMLEPDLDLEADLGIDTVKLAETFAAIREEWDIPRDENLKLRDYPTLGHAVRFVQERRPDAPAAPVGEPSAAADGDEAAILERVLAIVAEKTGYPAEMLEPDLDLEADLGIDTVKLAETFAAIREEWNIPRDENLKLRDYPTLAHAVRFVQERRPDGPPESSQAPVATPSEAAGGASVSASEPPVGAEEAARAVRRREPVCVLRPAIAECKASGVSLESGTRVALLSDRGGVGRALQRRLEARGVEVVSLDAMAEDLEAGLRGAMDQGPIQGLYWLPALDVAPPVAELDLPGWREALEQRVKRLFAASAVLYDTLDEPGAFLVAATRMGGRHGLDAGGATCPLGGAVSGFVKALSRERPGALIKVVDFAASRRTKEPAEALIEETLADPGVVEVGRAEGSRFGVALLERGEGAEPGLALDGQSVFLVTGAAGSIVSAITTDLARGAGGGVFHLFDLTPEPDPADPDIARFATDPDGLRREIFERLKQGGERATPVMVEREMAGIERGHAAASLLGALRDAGAEAHWHAVDLTDAEAVGAALAGIREQHERVDVLLHAAGFERSRPIPDKPREEFELIFDVKADGWFNLLKELGDTPLGATVAFSSIAGRFGNAGQTDYSSANDLLCKWATRLGADRAETRALAIDWTAWADIGMASRGSIPQIMERAGIDMLDPAAGIPIVRQEITSPGRSGEVLIGGALGVLEAERDPDGGLSPDAAPRGDGPMAARWTALGLSAGVCGEVELDPSRQPFLDHHRIDGTPVLPGVMGLEGFAALVAELDRERRVLALEDVSFLAPFKFYRDEPRTLELAALLRENADSGGRIADCRLVGRRELAGRAEPQVTEHFRARVRTSPEPAATVECPVPGEPPAGAATAEDVYRIYFHGPAYQVLDRVWSEGEGRVVGRMAEGLPADRVPDDSPLVTRPLLLELCFQTAGVAEIARTGRLGLPSRIARVALGGHDEAESPVCAVVEPGEEGVNARVVDARGRVLLEMDGYQTMALPEDLPDAVREPLAAALEGGEE